MDTPRASASVDQMRNVQRTASCGGAWLGVRKASRGKETEVVGISCDRTDKTGEIMATGAGFAGVDCMGFCRSKMHDFIFAQHAGQSVFCAVDMLSAQACAGIWGARVNPRTSRSAISARISIGGYITGIKCCVQSARWCRRGGAWWTSIVSAASLAALRCRVDGREQTRLPVAGVCLGPGNIPPRQYDDAACLRRARASLRNRDSRWSCSSRRRGRGASVRRHFIRRAGKMPAGMQCRAATRGRLLAMLAGGNGSAEPNRARAWHRAGAVSPPTGWAARRSRKKASAAQEPQEVEARDSRNCRWNCAHRSASWWRRETLESGLRRGHELR